MSCVKNTSSQILKNLQPAKDKRSKLIKSKESVDKFTSIINLVPKLKEYVEDGNFLTAAQHYLRNKYLLEQYQHSQSFKGIMEESKDIIWYIQGKLKNRLDCLLYNSEEISATLNLILELGEVKEDFLHEFLLISKDNLNQILLKIKDNYLIENDDIEASVDYKIFGCSDLSCKYLDILSKTINIVRRVFLREEVSFCGSSVLTNFVTTILARLFTRLVLIIWKYF
ncbi:vacuolar protein sorting-associated protein 51 [Nephila pilipes]|uniref:Vacuolar protein sorting-associated protein 51 homolog n=1 Tax=Nephila pilipes TaxID=299642 RepID=A0A8X6TW17_NEPPI|nr:vacuolar protein sorting-associated protein 51 [Nephila pilipes]